MEPSSSTFSFSLLNPARYIHLHPFSICSLLLTWMEVPALVKCQYFSICVMDPTLLPSLFYIYASLSYIINFPLFIRSLLATCKHTVAQGLISGVYDLAGKKKYVIHLHWRLSIIYQFLQL